MAEYHERVGRLPLAEERRDAPAERAADECDALAPFAAKRVAGPAEVLDLR
jgi:hypothetical protein